jgi:UDP-hydrolysing UDP-N-acetyl-D-glucosamine 2-epimerase
MRKIALVTGSRAEYWLLRPLIKKLQGNLTDTMLFVTGDHLITPGLDKFKADNLKITEKVKCLSTSDSYLEMAQAISGGISQFAEIYTKYRPSLIILLGDRYEIFAAASAAYTLKIPIAHLHGGEVTHGALDDGFRHSISKMASLHFVAHDIYKKRLMKMGEDPNHIYTVGAIGLDNIKKDFSKCKIDLGKKYPELENKKYFLLTLHANTLGYEKHTYQSDCVLQALEMFPEYKIVVTQSNYDPDGYSLNKIWKNWAQKNPRVLFVPTLGDDYLTVASCASIVIGNSSSGILEIPYLDVPVVNIGNRQDGRIFPKGVFSVDFDKKEIMQAMQDALNYKQESGKIYGKPGSVTQNIYNILMENLDNISIYKRFYDA